MSEHKHEPVAEDVANAGGKIISGHGDEVPNQTAGGEILDGHGDEVPNQTKGGRIIDGQAD